MPPPFAPPFADRLADSLASVVRRNAERRPDAAAFLCDGEVLRWPEYHASGERIAAGFVEAGFAPGERIGVLLPDGPLVHQVWLGLERAGLVVVGIGPRSGPLELEHLLQRSGARALVSLPEHRGLKLREWTAEVGARGALLRHHVEVAPDGALRIDGERRERALAGAALERVLAERALGADDVFLLNPTSGTTGMPKLVIHDQRRWYAFHELAVEAAALAEQDVFMSLLSAPFGFGVWTSHVTPALLGAPTVLLPKFDAAAALAALERHAVSVLAAVSTQFILLLEAPERAATDFAALRALFTGGEMVPRDRAEEFEQATGACVLQFYGSNETGGLSRTSLDDAPEDRWTTAGRVIDAMRVRILDRDGRDLPPDQEGQPVCCGPLASRGYWDDPAANEALFTPDGWLRMEDRASVDARGYLRVTGRSGDFIIRGGKNISGPAVEAQVATHPAVALAAAVAMPDPIFGERVCVYAELRPGCSLGLAELAAHLERRGVSREWFPERLETVAELPRASGGKIAKGELRRDIRAKLASEGRFGRGQ